MRINYSGNKKRREEAQKKKQQAKREKRFNKSKNNQGEAHLEQGVNPAENSSQV